MYHTIWYIRGDPRKEPVGKTFDSSDSIHSFVTFCEYFLPNLGEGKLILNT